MTYYPLTHTEQCSKCGGLPPGHRHIGELEMGTKHFHECQCRKPVSELVFQGNLDEPLWLDMYEKPLGPHRPTGRKPTARLATSEPPLTRGWTVVWKGTRGSCKAMVKRIRDRVYGSVPAEAAVVSDPDENRYLVIWRLPHERNDGTGTDDHVPGPDRA